MPGDYRIFVGAFPAGPCADRIQALRTRHDPVTARITPPHVTVAGTYWRSGPATPENERGTIDRLATLSGKIPAFDLVLSGVSSFAGSTVVYLAVEPTPGLLSARHMLLGVMGRDSHDANFTPHLTLAMRLGQEAARALLAQLQSSEWGQGRCAVPGEELQLMQRGPGDKAWRCIYRLPLAPANAQAPDP